MQNRPTVDQVIQALNLKPLPREGGMYRQTWVSTRRAAIREGEAGRPFGSAIFYLLTGQPDSFSALHRLPTDEVWHFYLGDPLEMTLLYPDGSTRGVLLGPDILDGQQVQFVAPAGAWQGTRLVDGGQYALVGTTMAPAYASSDLEIGDREWLLREYPSARQKILALTRAVGQGL